MAIFTNTKTVYLPSNVGGVMVQVDPATPVDNIFVFSDGTHTFQWTPNFRGIYHLSQARILANDATDKTSILQAIFDNSSIQTVILDSQQIITIDGTVDCGGKKIVFENGGRFTGNGTLSNFSIVATYDQWIFSTSINIEPITLSTDMWSVKWFGALGDGLTNDQPAIQRAVDVIIALQEPSGTLPKTLYYPPAIYRIDAPILCFKWTGTDYSFFTLNMVGQRSAYFNNDDNEAKIVCTYGDTFAIGYQLGRSSTIEGLIIQGVFNPVFSDYSTYVSTPYADWADASTSPVRDEPNSPYAGIVIEPFDNTGTLPEEARYPGLENYYRGSGANPTSGSSGIQIKECRITGFVGDIVLSPNGQTQNAENIHVIDCTLQYAKAAYISCQDQIKDNFIIRAISWETVHTCIDSLNYGIGSGQAPYVDGWNIAGNVIQLYQIQALRSQSSFKNIFSEGLWRIGDGDAGTGLTIQDCTFNFALQTLPLILPTTHITGSRVVFRNCTLKYLDNQFDKKIIVKGSRYIFDDCEFDLPPLTDLNYSNENIVSAVFRNCTTAAGRLTNYASGVGQFTGSNPVYLAYGRIILGDGGLLSNNSLNPPIVNLTYSFDNGGYQRSLNIGNFTLTVDTSAKTAIISGLTGSDAEYQIAIGDYLLQQETGLVLGKITAINRGAGSATLSFVPLGINSATINMSIIWHEVIIGQFIGDLTMGSATITNCEFDDIIGLPFVGQRLKIGHNRYNLIVDAVGANTITMSKAADYSETAAYNGFTNSGSNNPVMQFKSLWWTPDVLNLTTSNFTPMVSKGAICYTQINGVGNGNNQSYVCTRAGYLDAATVGKTNQSKWTLLNPSALTYTPTLTNVDNISSSTPKNTIYQKLNNVINVSGEVDVTPTANTTLTKLGISLPFASNFTQSYQLNGGGSNSSTITADTTNDRAELSFTSVGTSAVNIKFWFTYLLV